MSWNVRSGDQEFVPYTTRANRSYAKGDYALAQRIYQEGYTRAAGDHNVRAEIVFLNDLGGVQFATFDYRGAIDAFVRARDLARKNRYWPFLSIACANLCSLYMQLGDTASAQHAAEQGLIIPSSAALLYRSQLLGILGLLAANSGDGARANEYLRQAVESAETYGDDRMRFQAWSHYAQRLFESGDLSGAETAALNAWRIGGLASVREKRPAWLTLAQIYRARGRLDLSLSLIDRGIAVPPRATDRQLWKMYFLYERAMISAARQKPEAATADLGEALEYARQWREAIAPADNLRSGAEFWLKNVYSAYISSAIQSNLGRDAFLAAEEERSSSLLQMLLDGPRGARPAAYLEQLARLRASEIARIAKPSSYEERHSADIRQELAETEARAAVEIIPVNINKTDKKNENFLSPNTLSDIQGRIGPEEAILSFYLKEPASLVWGVTRGGFEWRRLAGRQQLEKLARGFRRSVEESAPDRDRLAGELYEELFGKVSRAVLRKRSWILTSDDSLFEAPLAALVVETKNGRPVYLIEKHEMQRIPTALTLTTPPPPPASGPFMGVGDGIYNTADARWPALRGRGGQALFGAGGIGPPMEMPRLSSSRREVESCAAAWGGQSPPLLLEGANASSLKLVAAMRRKPAVIHIAAHFLSPPGEPDRAVIDLGLTSAGALDVLTAEDVAGLHADGALVALSGCSSAAAKALRGAGIMGLTRAWLLAGAVAVVGSRWPVPDDTGELFRSFYARLAVARPGRSGLSSALRQAQLDMLRSSTWRSDPKYWSAFYLMTKE